MVMDEARLRKTLEDLDGERWGSPTYGSHVVREAHRLRRIPIGDLTIENLRLLIGQKIGLDWLVPLALARLVDEPLAEGDFYPGDLVTSVLRIDGAYWDSHPDELLALWRVRESLEQLRATSDPLLTDEPWPAFG